MLTYRMYNGAVPRGLFIKIGAGRSFVAVAIASLMF
jgi:hypothetical protein